MTLKEKFKKIDIKLGENDLTYLVDKEAIQCEKIADEFAIGFAEWYKKIMKAVEYITYEKNWMNKTTKELLEIYKKEKGL